MIHSHVNRERTSRTFNAISNTTDTASKFTLFFSFKNDEDMHCSQELERYRESGYITLQLSKSRQKMDALHEGGKFEAKNAWKLLKKAKLKRARTLTIGSPKKKKSDFIITGSYSHLGHTDDLESLKPMQQTILTKIKTQNAHFYVCGMAGYAKTVQRELVDILSDVRSEGVRKLCKLAGQGRYTTHLYGTAGLLGSEIGYTASDVARNNGEGKFWVSYKGKVFDLTDYLDMHPGGDNILLDKGGQDCTMEFLEAHGKATKDVEAIMSVYEIGVLKEPVDDTEQNIKHWKEVIFFVLKVKQVITNELNLRHSRGDYGSDQYGDEIRGEERAVIHQKMVLEGGYIQKIVKDIEDKLKVSCSVTPMLEYLRNQPGCRLSDGGKSLWGSEGSVFVKSWLKYLEILSNVLITSLWSVEVECEMEPVYGTGQWEGGEEEVLKVIWEKGRRRIERDINPTKPWF
ncbi:hypothetical protein TL16_g07960 [Triparma laevis f. inornata]|uniref:Cytochrome b5 heme-binding domain-containing protein n=1 Tax=Triparma laevis f. inornata TaxID=1714386 RepID=A0A9W7B2Q8_9STRA|nr:hypothetical protein TL16_g07960 [Triparma laevis f. inornata]